MEMKKGWSTFGIFFDTVRGVPLIHETVAFLELDLGLAALMRSWKAVVAAIVVLGQGPPFSEPPSL